MDDYSIIESPTFLYKYKSWKRKNITVRGIKNLGEDNGVYGSYGKGLYSAPLSNAKYARGYGKLYFVYGGVPQNPYKAQYSFVLQNYIYKGFQKMGYEKRSDFEAEHDFSEIFLNDGYDGFYIQGAEYCHFKPKDVKYFDYKNEKDLKLFYLHNFYKDVKNESMVPSFEEFIQINESENSNIYTNLIICDIQPLYESYFNFDMSDVALYLNNFENIYFYYNGPDLGCDDLYTIKEWLLENGVSEDKIDDINFYEKGYGHYREAMDYCNGYEEIVDVLRYMKDNDIYSSDELDIETLESIGVDNENYIKYPIYIHIDLQERLDVTDYYTVIGGGRSACLAELEIDLMVLDKSYIKNDDLIY